MQVRLRWLVTVSLDARSVSASCPDPVQPSDSMTAGAFKLSRLIRWFGLKNPLILPISLSGGVHQLAPLGRRQRANCHEHIYFLAR